MRLTLQREQSDLSWTMGTLSIDGEFECYTLEDVVREIRGVPVERWKVKGETAIPAGVYPVSITFSKRFQRMLPLIENVPGFEGIRIHTGNTDADTEGCILVGAERSGEAILRSREAYAKLFTKLTDALAAGESVSIEIVNSPEMTP